VEEQRLWAPWRLEYIKGPKPDECIFCAAAESDDDPGHYVLARGERCFVVLNAYPYNNGHLMVAPYEHVASLEALPDAALLELMQLTQRSLAAMREAYDPEGFNVGVNLGKVAGAGVEEHVHLHVVPRWGGDTSFMPVIGNARVLPQSLDDSYATLSKLLGRAPSGGYRVRRVSVDPSIFKAYDVRGLYGEQLDEELAYRIGRGFARVLGQLEGKRPAELRVAVGRDMRLSAPAMAERYVAGVADEGADVTDIGMAATEMVYFTVGSRELDGGLVCTASHNPKAYTGAKLVKSGAIALSGESGIGELRDIVAADPGPPAGERGEVTRTEVGDEFRAAALRYIDPAAIRPMKVVLDGGNGMAGPMVGPLLDSFPLEQVRTYWEPNGEFPDHEPNPLLENNRRFIVEKVLETGAELGIAWDGDADRCFFIDDTGQFVDGDFLTALLAQSICEKEPGARILYDVRASRAVPDVVAAAGGESDMNRVGHAFFKTRMRDEGAAFGGEVSGHYYFRDFYCADSGTIPALLILELLSTRRKRLSDLLEPLRSRYFISGEINTEVADQQAKMEELAERYADGRITRLDGVSVDFDDWHFNVRPSNTEPLLRLNLESVRSPQHMEAKRDEVLGLIRG
jgi:phosphomannomutase